jgi:hypothetical protein
VASNSKTEKVEKNGATESPVTSDKAVYQGFGRIDGQTR